MSYFNKQSNRIPCSVSKELVDYIASLKPELRDDCGNPNIGAVLFILGFDVTPKSHNRHHIEYYLNKGALVRCKERPSLVYKTDVYNGTLRKEVLTYDEYNGIRYDEGKWHYMRTMYIENEILTLSGLDMSMMEDINNIGIKSFYDDGMAAMDKRIDPEKPIRNIVRP